MGIQSQSTNSTTGGIFVWMNRTKSFIWLQWMMPNRFLSIVWNDTDMLYLSETRCRTYLFHVRKWWCIFFRWYRLVTIFKIKSRRSSKISGKQAEKDSIYFRLWFNMNKKWLSIWEICQNRIQKFEMKSSMPVGCVELLYMFPMNFKEFLVAIIVFLPLFLRLKK